MFSMRKRCGPIVVASDAVGSGATGTVAQPLPQQAGSACWRWRAEFMKFSFSGKLETLYPLQSQAPTMSLGEKLATAQDEAMKIGELAKAAHTQVETIRYYEREGLLPETARTDGNYRMYAEEHVDRLSFIRHCRGLDMTLDEIRVLLRFKDAPHENCAQVNDLLDEHIDHVATRIKELKALERQLKTLRESCRESQQASQCGILTELSSASRQVHEPATRRGHVHGAHSLK